MRNYLALFLFLIIGLLSELDAQDCAQGARGNASDIAGGRYFLMFYDNVQDRDAALANIESVTIDGITYDVEAHPDGPRTIRTTDVQPIGTFPVPFSGFVTLNPSGEVCEYFASVLPISVLNFNAVIEKSAVVVKWETAQEINNDGFEIQTSTDGVDFETFTWTAGAGTTNQTQYYEVRHKDYSKGINYYRFKQIDYDGAFYFSPIVSVNIESPNLARLNKNVFIRGEEAIVLGANNGTFEIFNAAGNKVSSGLIEGPYRPISTVGFNAGIYFIRMEGGDILKFIIK